MPDAEGTSDIGHGDPLAAYRGLAPGWYRDADDPTLARYWDGVTLGEERQPVVGTFSRGTPPQQSPYSEPPPRPEKYDPAVSTVVPERPTSTADELEHLARLRDEGILTDAEFQAQKAHILQVALLSGPFPSAVPLDVVLASEFSEPVSVIEPVPVIGQVKSATPLLRPHAIGIFAKDPPDDSTPASEREAGSIPIVRHTTNRRLVWALMVAGTISLVACVIDAVALGPHVSASNNDVNAWLIFGMVVGVCLMLAAALYDYYKRRPGRWADQVAGWSELVEASRGRREAILARTYVGHGVRCPTCGSERVTKVKTSSRVTNAAMGGLLFTHKWRSQFECKNCRYLW